MTTVESPRAVIIRTAGTNCDAEMVRAFQLAGAAPELVHLDALIADPRRLADAPIIGFPGGFSYGDDIAAGRVFAVRVRRYLYPSLRDAVDAGACIIGVCNGFQVLAQAGLLPGAPAGAWPDVAPVPAVGLAHNASDRFIDTWAAVEPVADSVCIWTRDLPTDTDTMRLPLASGEGRFVADSDEIAALDRGGQIALRYRDGDNPNGSTDRIAGICDPSGRIFGLMPHPDRYLGWHNHPFDGRLATELGHGLDDLGMTPGLRIFRNAVEAVTAGRIRTG